MEDKDIMPEEENKESEIQEEDLETYDDDIDSKDKFDEEPEE